MRRQILLPALAAALSLGIGFCVFAQQPAAAPAAAQNPRVIPEDHRPPLFFRETWKAGMPAKGANEAPITQELVTSPNLTLQLYGPGGKDVQISQHQSPKDDPTYVWTGLTQGNWAVTLKDKTNFVDLSGPVAKIRWRVKEAGFHMLRPVVKLSDGTYLIGNHTEGYTADWYETEFPLADVRWRKMDPKQATEAADGKWIDNPDLSKVDEVGFTDLAVGSGHGAGGSTRVDWIEVYGNPVPRSGALSSQANP